MIISNVLKDLLQKRGYTHLKSLGAGSFGAVWEVEDSSGNIWAAKLMNRVQEAANEAEMMQKFKHPNIVGYREAFELGEDLAVIVMEKCDGDVKSMVFSEDELKVHMHDIFSTLKVLHDEGVAHRDIKPANLLMNLKESGDFQIKLMKFTDFGLAGTLTGPDLHFTSAVGTALYSAPEVLVGNEEVMSKYNFEGVQYGTACDIWSLAVTMYELSHGRHIFAGQTPLELYTDMNGKAISTVSNRFHIGSGMSEEFKDLMEKMLEWSQKDRYTVDDCLQHDWFHPNRRIKENYFDDFFKGLPSH